jgi:hypothetical protein
MTARHAACSCEQLRLTAEGEPVRISVCHCLACQRRTGSAFGVQARFPVESVRIEGRYREYVRICDEREGRTFSFPECGATVFYKTESEPEDIVVPVGAFADPRFPEPRVSVWESRPADAGPGQPSPVLRLEHLRAEMSGQLRS